jgi:hypothetical protein
MNKIKITDLRGWDQSDPFTLPIIGTISELEKEGLIKEDIPKRKETVGETSLALSDNLDYYSFVLLPELNILIKEFKQNLGNTSEYKDFLRLALYITLSIKTLSTINELTRLFVIQILRYMKLTEDKNLQSLDKESRKKLLTRAKTLIEKAQGENQFSDWYGFIDRIRDFCEHEGSLSPSYIDVDEKDLIFVKKNTQQQLTESLNDIIRELKRFKDIRQITQEGLKNKDFWKEELSKEEITQL